MQNHAENYPRVFPSQIYPPLSPLLPPSSPPPLISAYMPIGEAEAFATSSSDLSMSSSVSPGESSSLPRQASRLGSSFSSPGFRPVSPTPPPHIFPQSVNHTALPPLPSIPSRSGEGSVYTESREEKENSPIPASRMLQPGDPVYWYHLDMHGEVPAVKDNPHARGKVNGTCFSSLIMKWERLRQRSRRRSRRDMHRCAERLLICTTQESVYDCTGM
jgi:hypothetical protein